MKSIVACTFVELINVISKINQQICHGVFVAEEIIFVNQDKILSNLNESTINLNVKVYGGDATPNIIELDSESEINSMFETNLLNLLKEPQSELVISSKINAKNDFVWVIKNTSEKKEEKAVIKEEKKQIKLFINDAGELSMVDSSSQLWSEQQIRLTISEFIVTTMKSFFKIWEIYSISFPKYHNEKIDFILTVKFVMNTGEDFDLSELSFFNSVEENIFKLALDSFRKDYF